MTPAEIVASGAGLFHTSQQYKEAGITLVENSAAEILDAALEMMDLPKEPQAFWTDFPRSTSPHTGGPLHGEIRLKIGSKFLELYED
jgi:hypothetical protein